MRPKILYKLFSNIISLKGIGPKNAKVIERLCGKYVIDLLFHKPSTYIDRRNSPKIVDLEEGKIATIIVTIDSHSPSFNKRMPYRINCTDDTGAISIVYFNLRGPYLKKIFPVGRQKVISGKFEKFNENFQITHPQHVVDLENLDNVKKIECIYPLTAGLTSKTIQKSINSALINLDPLPEWIPDDKIKGNNWPNWNEAIKKIHNPVNTSDSVNSLFLERLVFDELLAQQLTIRLIKNKISHTQGIPIKRNNKLIKRLEENLDFSLTNDQLKTIDEISSDQSKPNKMLRLLQGDVGSGKTIVALFAMMQCLENEKRSILMAPTEILAEQHFNTIAKIIDSMDLTCSLITSSTKESHNFKADILIGTHALFQEKVSFDNIGLVVIDEQHKFGVHQRILLNEKAGNECDVLLMTATPIPRTLELAAYGDTDISKIMEKPKNRKEINTKSINITKVEDLKESLNKIISKGEKIYWVCPLVDESEKLQLQSVNERLKDLRSYYSDYSVEIVHGQMQQEDKNSVMQKFKSGKVNILVATSVIEVGIDDPDATVIIIENAERFGLSQLHQLRGRVGRGEKTSTCILLFNGPLTENAKRRIKIMKETNDG
ncbi:ATP-dependent DNA helicase RecG, partial [Pelagibacteraceae bacterium]|nr:ATP-dependent DNA helicase RecG [Pelagibacteraceae bacterium]